MLAGIPRTWGGHLTGIPKAWEDFQESNFQFGVVKSLQEKVVKNDLSKDDDSLVDTNTFNSINMPDSINMPLNQLNSTQLNSLNQLTHSTNMQLNQHAISMVMVNKMFMLT